MSDLLKALQLIWDFEAADSTWYARLAEHGDRLLRPLGATHGSIVWDFGWDGDGEFQFVPRGAAGVPDGFSHQDSLDLIGEAPSQEALSAAYRRAPVYGTAREQLKPDPNHDHIVDGFEGIGYGDTVGLAAGDANGGLQIQGLADRAVELAHTDRWLLGGVCAHISSAIRLRRLGRTLESDRAAAVLDADGDLVHCESNSNVSALRERLRERVLAQRQTRDAKALSPDGALEAWTSMVDGAYTLIDHFEHHGRRLFLLFKNPYAFRNPAALSPRQRDVTALASRGQSNRAIGMTLGIAESTVASHLATAMVKLGLSSRAQIVRYLDWECGEVQGLEAPFPNTRVLEVSRHDKVDLSGLTTAELEVARLATRGASNTEIAEARGTTSRTVANQLASIYDKLGIGSRSELASLVRE